jgi:hypothetical protein
MLSCRPLGTPISGIVFTLLFLLACASSAQNPSQETSDNPTLWEPPVVIEFPQSPKSTVSKEMITGLEVGGLEIVLEETEMAAVQKRLGGTIGHHGDAGDSLSWLCLHGSDPQQGKWVLWLMSSEIDGNSVGGFRWQRMEPKTRLDARCRTLPKGKDGIQLSAPLRLGIPESKVSGVFGPPTDRVGDSRLYQYEHEGTIHGEPFTAINTLMVELRQGFVWAIVAWKSTTS